MPVFLAIDLGAGSGRIIAAELHQHQIQLSEIHRFDNPGTDLPGGSFWNIVGLFRDIQEGLRRAVDQYGNQIVSIGIDTWGCDFGLLDAHGRLLGMPHQYRDPRHEGIPAAMHRLMPERTIYQHTGITTNFYNSSLHLLAEKELGSPALDQASELLFIPDLLAYWLCGERAVERTIASTSQLLDPTTGDWSWPVIDALGLPRRIFGRIVDPGTILGTLRREVGRAIGRDHIPVVASASHDTASAVAGIPMTDATSLWLSSGTWSIMGIESSHPILSDEAFDARCCNELGAGGKVRFLKNIAGLWLIQECRRQWQLDGENLSYQQLAQLAEAAEPFSAFIDPDDPVFASPGEMPSKIQDFCRRTGQKVPDSKGSILRVASESLALKYRVVYDRFVAIAGISFPRLFAGGGGIQNAFLSQATADAIGIEVIAGPIEATSCGNVLLQMLATGHIPDLATGREWIRQSFEFKTYQPRNREAWQSALERFRSILPAT